MPLSKEDADYFSKWLSHMAQFPGSGMRFARNASTAIPQDMTVPLSKANASLPSYQLNYDLPQPRYISNDLTAAGFTPAEGPLSRQVIVAGGQTPEQRVNTLGHEIDHSKRQAYGAPTTHGVDIESPLNNNWGALRNTMRSVQPEDSFGPYWGMNASKSAEEQLANLRGYEASLPKGTSILDTDIGRKILNTQELRDYYFTQTSQPTGGIWEGQSQEPGLSDRVMSTLKGLLSRDRSQ